MTSIAVAIISYNTREHLRACLVSVQADAPRELVVVDNGSSDGSIEMVRGEFPEATLVVDPANPGYGAAANRAISSCSSPYVLLLNSDTRIEAGAPHALSGYLDRHPRAAMVGPRLANSDGSLQPSCFPFPSPLNTLLVKGTLGRALRYLPVVRERYLRTWDHSHPRVVPWVRGAALAIRREAFNAVGGFDETFFMYFEEVDLCHRLHNAGWQVHFAPVTTVAHIGGSSTMRQRTEMTVRQYASTMHYYHKHHAGPRLAALIAADQSVILARLLFDAGRRAITRRDDARARIDQDLAAWRRILLGRWRDGSPHDG